MITHTIIMISVSDPDTRSRCLIRLLEETGGRENVEVVLVVRDDVRVSEASVRVIALPHHTSVPIMRLEGLRASRGEIVAMLEDDSLIAAGWLDAVLAADLTGVLGLAGALSPGREPTGLALAVFFCDYARFLPPLPGDAVPPGNHVLYDKPALLDAVQRHDLDISAGLYDTLLHAALVKNGERFGIFKGPAVSMVQPRSLKDITIIPFQRARDYACRRFSGVGAGGKLFRAAAAILLPPLLTVRTWREVWPRSEYRRRLFGSAWAILVYHTAWAAGEFVGIFTRCDTMEPGW